MNNMILNAEANYEVIKMSDSLKFHGEAKTYFESLPKLVQESIVQSDVQLHSKEDLERFVNGLMKSGQFGDL